MRHRKMASFPPHLSSATTLPWEITEHKNDQFRRKRNLVPVVLDQRECGGYNESMGLSWVWLVGFGVMRLSDGFRDAVLERVIVIVTCLSVCP